MAKLSKELLLDMYSRMSLAREFDMKLNQLVRRDFVQGMTHFSVGEEAASIAPIMALKKEDIIFSNHRGHANCIGKGMDIKGMMAELAGKATGVSKGKGGSMHLADIANGNYGTNGVVGGGMAVSVGAALAQKYHKTGNVVVCFFGDGATNEGNFHESLNMASVWKLPLIYFITNNKYGISMDINRAVNIPYLYKRADAYGIPGHYVEDGNDAIAVYEEFVKALEYVRAGKGPVLMEVQSYRWFGHSTADPGKYRTKEEVDEWKTKDPLLKLRAQLVKGKYATDKQLDDIDAAMKVRIEEAVEFAKNSPDPDPSVVYEDVYVD